MRCQASSTSGSSRSQANTATKPRLSQRINLFPMSLAAASNASLSILAILFTRFEDIEGYVVAAADPPEALGEHQFKDIGYHFLPDKEVCGRVITLFLDNYRIIGVPVCLEGSQYSRKALTFCICFVIDSMVVQADMGLYKRLAEQLANSFSTLEKDQELRLLSDDRHLPKVAATLVELRKQLNDPRRSHVFVSIADSHSICFKPFGVPKLKQRLAEIKPYFVPYLLVDPNSVPAEEIDALAVSVLSLVDGAVSVGDICSKLPSTPAKVVMSVLRLLAGLGCVALLPPVDEFSRFCLTPAASNFFVGLSDRAEASEFCGLAAHEVSRSLAKLRGQPFSEFSENANAKKIIIFGLIKNIVRAQQLFAFSGAGEEEISRSCDGRTAADDLCAQLGISRAEFFNFVNSRKICQIWK